jgi:Flp pilus assembly pilin Flp
MLFALKEKGQGLVEYALILVLVAIVVIAVLILATFSQPLTTASRKPKPLAWLDRETQLFARVSRSNQVGIAIFTV